MIGFMSHKSLSPLFMIILLSMVGLIGYVTYELDGFGWRQSSSLPMTTKKLQEEQGRYWSGSPDFNFNGKSPRVIVYGDSQAFDIFSMLKNDPDIGLIYFPHSFKCSAFFSPNFGMNGSPELCMSYFDKLLTSKEIKEADYLIYSHDWEKVYETVESYPLAIARIKKINPKIKILFFGPKPYLGVGQSINQLLRGKPAFNVNQYLNSIKRIDLKNIEYSRALSSTLGVEFINVTALFCDEICPFYVEKEFSYFDSNHWTQSGGKIFYKRFSESAEFKKLK